jgi:hypothetical protein
MTAMTTVTADAVDLARQACHLAGIPATAIEPIRLRDNLMLRAAGTGTVIRILPPGWSQVAVRELRVADWMRSHRILTAEPLVPDPVLVGERPVTFWEDLGEQCPAEPAHTARALLRLHDTRVPSHLGLPRFTLPPFAQRIREAHTDEPSKQWLTAKAEDLTRRWNAVQWPDQWCVIHADPSHHNTMRGPDGTYLVDLEGVAIGPRQWDQAIIAVQSDTQDAPPSAWEEFRAAYGRDVTAWDGYSLLRDIRSMSLALFTLRHAGASEHARSQADYRLACLMGRHGPRPWKWVAP